MNARKVMLFAHLCNPLHMTGAEKLLLFQLKEWSRHAECMLVVPAEGQLAYEARAAGAVVLVEPYALHWCSFEPAADFLALTDSLIRAPEVERIANLLHTIHPDLVLCQTCVNFVPALAAARLGIPVFWCITERIKETAYTHQAVALIERYATWVTGISQTVLEPFQAVGLTRKLRIQYPSWRQEELSPQFWEGLRKERRAMYGVADSEVLIGFLASDLIAHKGFDHFVALALRLATSEPRARFLIAGKPTDEALYQSCLQSIHQSGFASRFILQPYSAQIQQLYPATDAIVVPSLIAEGFGLTALEAMAFGKAVVVYSAGALGEVQAACGNHSFIAPTGDVDGLVQIVRRLLADDGMRQAVSAQNQRMAEALFGLEAYRSRLAAFFAEAEVHLQARDLFAAELRAALPNGALARGSTSAVYRLESGIKRPFPDQDIFAAYGFQWADVLPVSDYMLHAFPTGPAITASYPPTP